MANTGTLGFALKNFWVDYTGWGRARRSEYWWVVLFYYFLIPFVISFCLNFVGTFCGLIYNSDAIDTFFKSLDWLVSMLWWCATLVPGFCLTARRLHDTDRSNWNVLWSLLPIVGWIVLLVFMASEGEPKKNRFGAPRK